MLGAIGATLSGSIAPIVVGVLLVVIGLTLLRRSE
jgi:hypothetical protein